MVGNERLTTYCFMLGGSGIVSGLSTAYPELLLQAYAACQHKDWDTAAALQRDINEKLDQFTHVSARRTGDVLLELAREHGVL
jgi:dihydrodipicolinate synthase/N-acetylneuraminate lyase